MNVFFFTMMIYIYMYMLNMYYWSCHELSAWKSRILHVLNIVELQLHDVLLRIQGSSRIPQQ